MAKKNNYLIWVIIIIAAIFILPKLGLFSVGTTSNCYQETATTATSCGGLSTGTYGVYPDHLTNPEKMVDGDWNTFGTMKDSNWGLVVQYAKPSNVQGAIWKVKTSNGYKEIPITPTGCWSRNGILWLGITYRDSSTYFDCVDSGYSGTSLYSESGKIDIYEEAIIWNPSASSDGGNLCNTCDSAVPILNNPLEDATKVMSCINTLNSISSEKAKLKSYTNGTYYCSSTISNPADTNGDGKVSDSEIVSYISKWVNNQISDSEIISAIQKWVIST